MAKVKEEKEVVLNEFGDTYPEVLDIPEFDPEKFESTMSNQELFEILDQIHQIEDILDPEACRLSSLIPLTPDGAMKILYDYGMEYVKTFNLADANKFYGNDWVERFGRRFAKNKDAFRMKAWLDNE